MRHGVNRGFFADRYPSRRAFTHQHINNVLGAIITKKLAQLLFVIGDIVLFHQRDEIMRRVFFERIFTKMFVLREEVIGAGMDIREVTAPAARYPNFLAKLLRMIEEQNLSTALARFDSAHHACRARSYNNDVERLTHI